MGGGQAAAPSYPEPKLGQVLKIESQIHLRKTVDENPGVVVDFWAAYCGPCMQFKPQYEAMAKANQNPKIVFCSVETDKVRDCA